MDEQFFYSAFDGRHSRQAEFRASLYALTRIPGSHGLFALPLILAKRYFETYAVNDRINQAHP